MYWDIAVPIPVKPLGFSIVSGNDGELDPMSIALYGYDDNGNETQLATKVTSFSARGFRLTYTTSTTQLFKHFRLAVTESVSSSVRLADFELYGAAIAENGSQNFVAPTSVEATAVGLSSTELIGKLHDGNRNSCYRAAFTEPITITFTYDQPISTPIDFTKDAPKRLNGDAPDSKEEKKSKIIGGNYCFVSDLLLPLHCQIEEAERRHLRVKIARFKSRNCAH